MSSVLQAKERKVLRHSVLKSIRKEGNIPGVIYGSKTENKSIYLSEKDLIKTIRDVGRNGIISLDVDGNKQNVILTDYQADPLKNVLVHVDFRAVDMATELNANVRVTLIGDAAGVKEGGVMQQSLHEVSVTATPTNIPQSIDVDVTNLQVEEKVTIADIKGAYASITFNHEEDEVICSILAPRQEEVIDTGEKQSDAPHDNLEETPANSAEE
ncbi:50S ribosomal protein L25/general stress protein Ctc [Bacillus tuaregi]|uniref:50S ribosomal protein L25/general stress protein Ctc n=1 Tax=Bacillus tuaregi TaxID=1816695 RepID=UPI0008F7F227|nr:50S ribosomal protein L25/general stress protein Ctc [Bacillus tuaregi]